MATAYTKANDVEAGDNAFIVGEEDTLVGLSERSVRHGFIRKVFSILLIQLTVTFGIAALFAYNNTIGNWVKTHPGVLTSALLLQFAFIIALACCEGVRRKHPLNMIVLGAFTLVEAYFVGAVTASYEIHTVMLAFIITLVSVVALTAYATQTKRDFTMMGGVLLCALIGLIMFGFLAVFFPGPFAEKVYAFCGALLFSAFLVYDIQTMMGDRARAIGVDEYIFAALNLYLDIINLFLFILSLLGGGRN